METIFSNSTPILLLLFACFFMVHVAIYLSLSYLLKNKALPQAIIHEIITYLIFFIFSIYTGFIEFPNWGAIGSSQLFIPLISFNSTFYLVSISRYSLPKPVIFHHLFYIGLCIVYSIFNLPYYLMAFPVLMGFMESVIIADGISILYKENSNKNLRVYLYSLFYKVFVLCICLLLFTITMGKASEYPLWLMIVFISGLSIHTFFAIESLLKSKNRIAKMNKNNRNSLQNTNIP